MENYLLIFSSDDYSIVMLFCKPVEYGDKLLMALVTFEFFSVELVHYPALQYKKDERNAKWYYDSNNMHSFIIALKPGP